MVHWVIRVVSKVRKHILKQADCIYDLFILSERFSTVWNAPNIAPKRNSVEDAMQSTVTSASIYVTSISAKHFSIF